MEFVIHSNLENKSFVVDLPLCRVLLEDVKSYPWVFLVPRRQKASRIMDLSNSDQLQLLQELEMVQKIVWQEFQPTQLNVAAIGNKTPQLHVHVIGRYISDPAWPHTVWDHPVRAPHDLVSKQSIVQNMQNQIQFYH